MTEPSSDPRPPAGHLYRLAWAFYLVLALLAVAWLELDDPERGRCPGGGVCAALFVDAESWPLDLALGVAAGLLVVGLWRLAAARWAAAAALEHRLAGLVGAITPDEAIAVALVSGFAEELFFRGAVQGSLGWPLATLLFALLHTGPGRELRLWGLFAVLVGLLFAGLVEWRENLLAAIVAHALVNALGLWRLSRGAAATAAEDSGGDSDADLPAPPRSESRRSRRARRERPLLDWPAFNGRP